MGSLASKGMVSWDQELDSREQKTALHRVLEIQAIQWKRQMQLPGSQKDASRELACRLIPELSPRIRWDPPVPSPFAVFGRAVRPREATVGIQGAFPRRNMQHIHLHC